MSAAIIQNHMAQGPVLLFAPARSTYALVPLLSRILRTHVTVVKQQIADANANIEGVYCATYRHETFNFTLHRSYPKSGTIDQVLRQKFRAGFHVWVTQDNIVMARSIFHKYGEPFVLYDRDHACAATQRWLLLPSAFVSWRSGYPCIIRPGEPTGDNKYLAITRVDDDGQYALAAITGKTGDVTVMATYLCTPNVGPVTIPNVWIPDTVVGPGFDTVPELSDVKRWIDTYNGLMGTQL